VGGGDHGGAQPLDLAEHVVDLPALVDVQGQAEPAHAARHFRARFGRQLGHRPQAQHRPAGLEGGEVVRTGIRLRPAERLVEAPQRRQVPRRQRDQAEPGRDRHQL